MTTETIDMTPTWTAIGEIYIRMAESNEQTAIRGMREDVRKAFAIASAATVLYNDWSDAEKAAFNTLVRSGGEK